ncbi:hypothetical protein ACKWTF_011593 [Chironomus riparius]
MLFQHTSVHLQTTLINNLSKTEAMTMNKQTKTSSRYDAVVSTLSQTEHHKSLLIKAKSARKVSGRRKTLQINLKLKQVWKLKTKFSTFTSHRKSSKVFW